MQMAAMYPQDEDEFSDIRGVGRLKLQEYGSKFTSVIREYVRANNITVDRAVSHGQTGNNLGRDGHRNDPSPTLETTREMVSQGLTVDEIAARRGLAKATIIDHIEEAAISGPFLDVSHLLPSGERLEKITEAFRESGSPFLYLARDRLGKGFTYSELKLVRIHLKQQGKL